MNLPEILRREDPSKFRNRRARIFRRKEGCTPIFLQNEYHTFTEMQQYRSKQTDPMRMVRELRAHGFLVANVGISIAFMLQVDNTDKKYALFVSKNTNEDLLLKLVSGYLEHKVNESFGEGAVRELAEEVLVTQKNFIYPNITQVENKEPIILFPYRKNPDVTHLVNEKGIDSKQSKTPHIYLKGIDPNGNFGKPKGVSIGHYSENNSSQIIYSVNSTLISRENTTLTHVEERLNKDEGTLDAHLVENGIVLIELTEEGKLTDHTFHYKNGVLLPGPDVEKITLSEAFVKPNAGPVVTKMTMRMVDYLERN